MEEEEAPASVCVAEMEEVTTVDGKKKESFQETVVTTVTTMTRMDVQERKEVETEKITEEEEEEEEEKMEEENEAGMEGGEENGREEKGHAKKLLGSWESEVRTRHSCNSTS